MFHKSLPFNWLSIVSFVWVPGRYSSDNFTFKLSCISDRVYIAKQTKTDLKLRYSFYVGLVKFHERKIVHICRT